LKILESVREELGKNVEKHWAKPILTSIQLNTNLTIYVLSISLLNFLGHLKNWVVMNQILGSRENLGQYDPVV